MFAFGLEVTQSRLSKRRENLRAGLGDSLLARFIRRSLGCDSKDGDEAVGFA